MRTDGRAGPRVERAGAIAVGLALAAVWATGARAGEVADPGWPMRRHDPGLSGRAQARGSTSEPPRLAWSFREEILEVDLALRARADGSAGAALSIDPASLPAAEIAPPVKPGSPRRRARREPQALVDLRGDGVLVPDPGKAARLVPGVKGLQTVTWEEAPESEGYLARRAVAWAHDGPEPRKLWTSAPFHTVQNTNHIVADVDADGALEVVLAPHYRIVVLDGATGRTEHDLRIHDLRNYGFFCAANLDADPELELVVIADFSLHIDVVDMDRSGPRLLWRRDIEEDIQSKRRIVRPGPDPVADLDGDGRREILINLYNDAGDGRWHVVALDAVTGERRLDIPGRYLAGYDDLDGDGRQELLVSDSPALYVPRSGAIEVVAWDPRRTPAIVPRWSDAGARFLTVDAALPLTHSTIVARGTETTATVGLGRGRERGFLVAADAAGVQSLRLQSLGRQAPVFAAAIPGGRRLRLRELEDGVDGSPGAVTVAFLARARESLALPPPAGADLEALAARPAANLVGRRAGAEGWVAVGSWAGKPAIFTENALGEVLALRAPPRGTAKAPAVAWRDAGCGPVILADLDGGGEPEAIYGEESPAGEGRIVAAGPAGRKWARAIAGFPGPHPDWNSGGVTRWWVGRFTTRERCDVWVSARRGTMHSDEGFVLDGRDGKVLWTCAEVRTPDMAAGTRGWGCGGGDLAAADIDGDSLDDLVSLYPVNYSVLRGRDGALLRSVSAASGLFEGVWGAYATPGVLDLDGDGRVDVLWSGPYHQGATTLEGKALWHHRGGTGPATAADLDGDGRLEVASTGWEKEGTGLRVLEARTGRLRSELALPENPRADVTAAELDGAPGEELLLAAGTTLLAAGWRDGGLRELWRLELPAAPAGDVAVADADGDGRAEILFAGRDGGVHCLAWPALARE